MRFRMKCTLHQSLITLITRMKDTLFLDRDGILNVQIVGGYVRMPEEFVLVNGVLTAMQWLRPKFRRLIVVTNQQCVGKRLCTMEDIDEIHRRMRVTFEENMTPLDRKSVVVQWQIA